MRQKLTHKSKNRPDAPEKQREPPPKWGLGQDLGLSLDCPSHRKLWLQKFLVTGDVQVPVITSPRETRFHRRGKDTEQRDDPAEG